VIKLVILDIDGVLTDGRKYYGIDGIPYGKTYCDKDFTAIKRMKGAGIEVCFLSGDERVNKAMANNRNIPFYSARGKDKAEFLEIYEKHYEVGREHMLYIGDDLFDKSIMELVGHAYCPSDACRDIRRLCGDANVLSNKGGCNVICELFDVLLDRGLISDCMMQDIENLDKKETF